MKNMWLDPRHGRSFVYLRSLGMTPKEAHYVLRICSNGGLFTKWGDTYVLRGQDGKEMPLPTEFSLLVIGNRRLKTKLDRLIGKIEDNLNEDKIDEIGARQWLQRHFLRKRTIAQFSQTRKK